MENQKKPTVRIDVTQPETGDTDRPAVVGSDATKQPSDNWQPDFAKESSTQTESEGANGEIQSRREHRITRKGMAVTGYASHAFEEFDPRETRVQLAEHYKFYDAEYARYGRF